MTRKELYNICHDEAVAYANSEQWSKRTGEEKSFLIQGYLDAMMEARKSEITEKKKDYPKTYEECCEIVKVGKEHTLEGATIRINYKIALLESFQKLLICRDAYWKIAGKEMGLGKPWEPDWKNDVQFKYVIICRRNCVIKDTFTAKDVILAFPTEEMRDAFKENFDKDLEFCKELL